MTFDGQDSGSIQFHLSQQQEVDNHYIFTEVKVNDIEFGAFP